jgi:hypothetical protein
VVKINSGLSCIFDINHEEKKSLELRKKVNELYFAYGHTKSFIMEKERVSKPFVIRWTRSPDQDFTDDIRGWPKGKPRYFSEDTAERIKKIYWQFKNDPHNFYIGATAVLQGWRRSYPEAPAPSLRTVGRVLKDLGLTHIRKGRNKGAAAYLCYPEYTIYSGLGGRVLEADFIGKKYISGRTAPVNFIGFSFKKEPRLRYYQCIESQTAECFIKQTDLFFSKFERPDYIKLDNALAMIGSASGKRNISSAMLFLLNHHVVPIFAVPRQPFSQASIEGNNSVFARLFWNRYEFSGLEEIDEQLKWFNESSLKYTNYCTPEKVNNNHKSNFKPEVIFIRQVREKNGTGFIEVLNDQLPIDLEYINYFVLARWSLTEQRLRVFFERDNQSILVHEFPFLISGNSLKKIHSKGKLSFDL